MTDNKTIQGLVNETQAASYLSLSTQTLKRLRMNGRGPIFCKFGRRVAYSLDDLKEWATSHRVQSTSGYSEVRQGV